MDRLSDKKQKILYCILQTDEKNSEGFPRADTSQIKSVWNRSDWGEISGSTLWRKLEDLVERGVLTKSQRSKEEMDTDRNPPSLYTFTDKGLELVQEGFDEVEEPVTEHELSKLEQLRTEIEELESEVESLREAFRQETESQKETSKHYYKKVSQQVSNNQGEIQSMVGKLHRLQTQITRLDNQIEALQNTVSELETRQNERKDNVNKAIKLVHNGSAEREAELKQENDKLREYILHIENFLKSEFDGGYRKKEYKPYNY